MAYPWGWWVNGKVRRGCRDFDKAPPPPWTILLFGILIGAEGFESGVFDTARGVDSIFIADL